VERQRISGDLELANHVRAGNARIWLEITGNLQIYERFGLSDKDYCAKNERLTLRNGSQTARTDNGLTRELGSGAEVVKRSRCVSSPPLHSGINRRLRDKSLGTVLCEKST
jgi:hypothetical protein